MGDAHTQRTRLTGRVTIEIRMADCDRLSQDEQQRHDRDPQRER
jgi:hypothetical protein